MMETGDNTGVRHLKSKIANEVHHLPIFRTSQPAASKAQIILSSNIPNIFLILKFGKTERQRSKITFSLLDCEKDTHEP